MLPAPIVLTLVAFGLEADCARIPDTTRIQVIGSFSDMRYTEEHAYGRTVELWRAGACVFGLLEVSEGLAGDTPAGELIEVRYDPGSGALSFAAKLTTGMTQVSGSQEWVPSRDLFRFTGRLRGKLLSGKLVRSDQLRPQTKPAEENIMLQHVVEQQGSAIQAQRYGEWRKTAEMILRFRGPKW